MQASDCTVVDEETSLDWSELDIAGLKARASEYDRALRAQKTAIEASTGFWYPYGTLGNFEIFDQLLHGENRKLLKLAQGLPIADIGAADGDLAYFLEQKCKLRVQIIDHARTNFNSLRGARRIKEAIDSHVEIYDVDLDQLYQLPQPTYGLVFFLGILYHLKNPFYALEHLAHRARYCLLSTRIARFTPDKRTNLSRIPVAYLLGASESNNDATNYWIFSEVGLRRILDRAGWDVVEYVSVGNTEDSDPASAQKDERAFCLLRSRWLADGSSPGAQPIVDSAPVPRPPLEGIGDPHLKALSEWYHGELRSVLPAGEVLERFHAQHPRCLFLKGLPARASVLDMGSGDGALSILREWPAPARPDLRLYAFSLDKGKYFDSYNGFEIGDWEQAPPRFEGRSFDAIFSSHFIEHIKSPGDFFHWVASRLKPGGWLFAEWPAPASQVAPTIDQLSSVGFPPLVGNFHDDRSHRELPSMEAVQASLLGAGLRPSTQATIKLPLFEDELLAHYRVTGDLTSLQFAYWLRTGWCQYVTAQKPPSDARAPGTGQPADGV